MKDRGKTDHAGVKRVLNDEERYKVLVQTVPDIIYELDADGRFVFISDALKELGYKPEELIGKHFKEIVHPDDFEAVNRILVLPKYKGVTTGDKGAPKLFDERRTMARITKDLEIRVLLKRPKEGSANFCYAEVNSSGKWDRPIQDNKKELIGSIGVIKDITERKESEKKWEDMFNAMQDLVFIQDKDFTILKVNKAMADALKIKPEDIIGRKCYDVLHNLSGPWPGCAFEKTKENGKVHTEEVDDPNIGVPLLITTSPLFGNNGEIIGSVHVAKDISNLKQARKKLHDSEELYRSIFEQLVDSIVLINAKTGQLTRFNEQAHKNLGYTREEFQNLKIEDVEVIESPQEVRAHIEKIMRQGQDTFETKHRRKDGEIRDILVKSKAIHFKGKKIIQSIWNDITERKKAQKELDKKIGELERFHKITVDRELAMINLKKEINSLLRQLGHPKKYKIHEEE